MTGRCICGTCSLCGGPVSVPDNWMCGIPAVPTCEQCGATAAQHGPVIPMVPQPTFGDGQNFWKKCSGAGNGFTLRATPFTIESTTETQ